MLAGAITGRARAAAFDAVLEILATALLASSIAISFSLACASRGPSSPPSVFRTGLCEADT